MQLERPGPRQKQHPMHRSSAGGKSALFAHGDLFTAERCRGSCDFELLPEGGDEIRPSADRCNPSQLRQREGTANPVCDESEVPLEFGKSDVSAVSEDSVHASGIEPQSAQTSLHLGDIVALQHGNTPIQETVTKAKTGLHETRPRLATADAVYAQSSLSLKLLHGLNRSRTEGARGIRAVLEAEPAEPFLQVGDGVAALTFAKREEVFFWRHSPCTAHSHEPCRASLISDMVRERERQPVALTHFCELSTAY